MPEPAKSRPFRLVLALLALGLAIALALTWLNRRTLAREALTGWLAGKGVAARAEVEAIGPTTFTARLSLGDPKAPDFTAERVDVRYRLGFSGMDVVSARLDRPVLRARLHGGALSVGALDPLVREFLARPPRPNATKPRVEIAGGRLLLASDYGPLSIAADALVDDAKLQRLTATSAPARLRGAGLDVVLGRGELRETTQGGRMRGELALPVASGEAGGATLRDGRLTVKLEAPYPDFVKRRGDGIIVAALDLQARDLAAGARRLRTPHLQGAFTGQSSGWIRDFALAGRATAAVDAAGGDLGPATVGGLRGAMVADNVRWSRAGGDRVAARLSATGEVRDLVAAGFHAPSLTLAAAGPMSANRAGLDLGLSGSVVGRGGWSGLGAPAPADDPSWAALKRALASFRVAAPGVALTVKEGIGGVALTQPVRLVPDTGGAAEIAPVAGGYRISAAGGGLPGLDAELTRIVSGAGATTAVLRLKARGDLMMARGAVLDAAGPLRIAGGATTFSADRCAGFSAARLELGVNDVEQVSGRLCQGGAPLFRMAGGGWRLAARAEGVAGAAPFAQVRVTEGVGQLTAASTAGRLAVQARIGEARVADAAPQPRFNPLTLSGAASLADFVWKADIAARRPEGAQVAQVHVVHDGGLGVGFATVRTGLLSFAEGGLQPAQLSPMAASLGSPATGQVSFDGRFDWTRDGMASQGALEIPGLDFQSPAGRVQGLKGEVRFTSLAPLTAAPGQTLRIAQLDAIVPVTAITASFAIQDNVLRVAGGEADVGGGHVRVESLELPMTAGAPTRGVLIFEGVQLHDIVEASPFGDKVDLDARVSGRVPFEDRDGRVRITGGDLAAIQPGRLSIDRTALSGVSTQGGSVPAAGSDPNATFTGFAYQAMEDLAFDTLTASLGSEPDGRMGVLFHIVGRHDPPKRQQIKMSVFDLLQRKFLGKPLPLPSGTRVDLTLDTTLNLDELLADYANYRKLHGSAQVQP